MPKKPTRRRLKAPPVIWVRKWTEDEWEGLSNDRRGTSLMCGPVDVWVWPYKASPNIKKHYVKYVREVGKKK